MNAATTNLRDETIAPYAAVVIKLLQDVLYLEDSANWELLLRYNELVREYFAKIGIELYIDEGEGFAYIRQPDEDQADLSDQARTLPRLVRRDRMSYHATLLCVLLRESLQQFDASGLASTRLIVSNDEIYDLLRPFFKERTDETRLLRTFDHIIGQVVGLGFLKQMTGSEENRYEVRRILRAKLSADTLAEIREKLEAYAESTNA